MEINCLTPVFLLHGLGARPITLLPLELYLNYQGYKNTYRLSYPVDKLSINASVEWVNNELLKRVSKEQEIILIGQSAGGRIANELHTKGWKIKLAIYIGSPLSGAKLLNQLESILPTFVRNALYKKPYDDLKIIKKPKIPPHPHHSITMGWFNTQFDGCVYQNEAKLNQKNHTHLAWSDHRSIFANPRLWWLIVDLIKKYKIY